MDANGTRYHLLLGKDDWARCTDEPESDRVHLHWDQQYHELTLQPRLFQFTPAPKDHPPLLDDRRGAGRDRFGNWYWIDKTEREILVHSVGTQVTSHFWSVGDGLECERAAGVGHFEPKTPRQEPTPLQYRGLAVTEDHYLVVGVLQPAGLLIFDLHSGGPPRQMLWPEAVEFTPFDMAPRPGGGVWILDRDFTRPFKPVRYWALDRHFNVIGRDQQETTLAEEQADDFQPKDRSAIRRTAKETFPRGAPAHAGCLHPTSNASASAEPRCKRRT